MSTRFILTVEIELPEDVSDEYQDALVEDMTYDPNIDRLKAPIKHWVRLLTGESCHVTVDWCD